MSRSPKIARVLVAGSTALAAALLVPGVAHATTFVVTNANASGPGSFNDAIAQANANGSTPDVITFSIPLPATIERDGSALNSQHAVEIRGPGADLLTLKNGVPGLSALHLGTGVAGASSKVSGVTLADSGFGLLYFPSNLDNELVLDQVVLRGNLHGLRVVGSLGSTTSVVVRNSTVSGNASGPDPGAGIYFTSRGNLRLDRTTVTNNVSGSQGGGILMDPFFAPQTLTLQSSTIAGNSASAGANIDVVAPDASGPVGTTFANSIVADPLGGGTNCGSVGAYASWASSGFNLSDDSSCHLGQGSDKQGVEPQLQALGMNGGSTPTRMLAGTSPAIDAGKAGVGETQDQRGQPRPSDFPALPNASGGDGSDIGAVEAQFVESGECKGRPATILGTEGDDLLTGTDGNDVISGRGGRDVVRAGKGNDIVCGGGAKNLLVGGAGKDQLYGGPAVDRLVGGTGNDRLFGGKGKDNLRGNQGNDRLTGGKGVDTCVGGAGKDKARSCETVRGVP